MSAPMDPAKRRFLETALFGAGWFGLRALATGIPMHVLLGPRNASAQSAATCAEPQYLYFLTSGSGDPMNANVPGCYLDAGIYHPMDATMAPQSVSIGGQSFMAAKPWATLDPEILARTAFLHHGTYTNNHGDAAKVNRLMGQVNRQEMLVSLISKSVASCLATVQSKPVVLSNNLVTYDGGVMPVLNPPALQAVLAAPTGPLANLQKIRDTQLDRMNALFKQSGNTAQRNIIDQYALSQTQARSLSQQLLQDLSTIKGTTRTDLNIAAVVLFKMNVSPAAVATYSFGGDNHGDTQLQSETTNTVASIAALADVYARLKTYGLQDSVTIALQNVFGRTLSVASHSGNADGRNHNANHHCSVFIGAPMKSVVIGGATLNNNKNDYRAVGFDAATGQVNDSAGDVPYTDTLASVGKTLAHATGVDPATIDTQITSGKVIGAALR
jgi:hypothetical protein